MHISDRWEHSADGGFHLDDFNHIGDGSHQVTANIQENMKRNSNHQEKREESAGDGHEYNDNRFRHHVRRHHHGSR
jgi:hypothetical protein